MKLKNIFLALFCTSVFFAGCEDEKERVVYPYSSPQISAVTYSITDAIEATDSLFFSMDISDPLTPLSTLEVELTAGTEVLYTQSIRTKGNSAQINKQGIYMAFGAAQEDTEARLTLTAINVEGSEMQETKNFTIKRPQMPQTLYLHYDDQVMPMTQSEENPYEYATESGEFPTTLSGKISTSETLANSSIVWGYSETVNTAELISATGAGFAFNFEDWQIERVTFNVFTFKLGIVGYSKDMRINGVLLDAAGGYFQAIIPFEQGQEVEVQGFENLEGAYNRDFFAYNEETGTLTFLRESGYWEVYYSARYNYMWVMRMDDVAPDAFWLVGHGFTAASAWNEDYAFGGWETDNVARLGYVVKIAENKYQTTIYLNDGHEWDSFEIEIYSNREWGKDNGIELQEGSLSGHTDGFVVSGSNGFTSSGGFVPGYYRLTFDTSGGVANEKMHIERIAD
ncbi:DUF5016 domain-containing protein [Bacteroides sp. OttesenSCG-928-E20]|nr:DUF5016 domain-containing protein [Bacteroides sp. OttesenSCG-928-N06]MDL2299910.1 DUF5016 domain-containing protein [Bacteroides sp. OttesenSCG-928-E20]